MGKKLALNVVYNIGVFICIITIFWAYPLKKYEFIAAAVLVAALFVFLKIKLLQEIRNTQKKP